jgi:ankyrin repeat protein
LLDAGASPNLPDKWGRTPLHIVAWCGKAELIKLLLKAGASPNVRDSQGRTPLDHVKSNSVALVAALRQAGGKTSAELAVQVESSRGSQTPETSIAHGKNQ